MSLELQVDGREHSRCLPSSYAPQSNLPQFMEGMDATRPFFPFLGKDAVGIHRIGSPCVLPPWIALVVELPWLVAN